jgi:dsRNA-specific ribonuclease
MVELKNSILLEAMITAIYNVASRRTSYKFADESIGSTIKTLEGKYDFLKLVEVNKNDSADQGFAINVSSDIDSINPALVGKAIEALIRVVYNDMNSEAGLYFVSELKELAGKEITRMVSDCDVDLGQLQLEQHHAYQRRERKKYISEATKAGKITSGKPENLIGYTWDKVSHWKHDPGSKYCTLYDKAGNILDRLNLDRIIQNYVEKLSGYIDVDPREIEKEASIYEKEYKLLKLLLERDMDAETAMHMLKIKRDELNKIISKLSQMEMLQYTDFNTVELTNIGIGYLSKKETK